MVPILGYWGYRALGEPIRFLLHYKKVHFEDKRYHYREHWFEKDKIELGLDFPNFPYYIEGDLKMTQSLAILRYLAEKYDLNGKSKEERLRISMVEQQLVDLFWNLAHLVHGEDFVGKKSEFIENVPAQFLLLENFLGTGKYLAGDHISYVDFLAYHVLDYYRILIETVFVGCPKLKAYHKRIVSLPELKEYLKTDYKTWPIFGPLSKFGYFDQTRPPHV